MNKTQIINSKYQINSKIQIPIANSNEKRIYDLEERTYRFAKEVSIFCKMFPATISNIEYSRQLIRSSGSVGANYIEANESLSRADFKMRIKICRKESKESAYWIRLLIDTNSENLMHKGHLLKEEGGELTKIFSSIVEKSW